MLHYPVQSNGVGQCDGIRIDAPGKRCVGAMPAMRHHLLHRAEHPQLPENPHRVGAAFKELRAGPQLDEPFDASCGRSRAAVRIRRN